MIVKPRNYSLVLDAGHGEYMPSEVVPHTGPRLPNAGLAIRVLFDPTEHDWSEADEDRVLAKMPDRSARL
jgi:hypothetical protein